MTKPKSEEEKKSAGRRPRSILDEMRTIAWAKDMMKRLDMKPTGLNELFAKEGSQKKEGLRFDMYHSGKRIPSDMNLNAIHQNERLARSRSVFETGPEENGNFVYFWMVFENRYDELWKPIDRVMSSYMADDSHNDRIDKLACLVIPAGEWKEVCENGLFEFDPNKPVEILIDDGGVVELKKLSAVIAMWRLSMLIRLGVTKMEYLLRCLLESIPYRTLLQEYGIYERVILLIRALAVNHYVLAGDLDAAASAFPITEEVIENISQD